MSSKQQQEAAYERGLATGRGSSNPSQFDYERAGKSFFSADEAEQKAFKDGVERGTADRRNDIAKKK